MSAYDEVGHRHLLGVEGLHATLGGALQSVRIIIPEPWASSPSGQRLAACLVNLLIRQIGLVGHIEIVAPRVRCKVRVPFGTSSEDFPACLTPLSAWAVNGAVGLTATPTTTPADHTIFVGSASTELIPPHGHVLTAIGEGWRAWVGDPAHAPRAVSSLNSNPLGPFLAAALAAGEIFKRGRGIRRGRYLTADGHSLWSGRSDSDWNALEGGPNVAGLTLRPVHIVGAGAVGNALAYIIANLGPAEAYLILIDDDRYDKTNLNRCLLAGWQDLWQPKVVAVAEALHAAGVNAFPFCGSLKSYVADARTGLRADVARQVNDLDFEIVASCVDKGLSRQDVQGLRPRLLLGGSTLNLQAKCNLYSGRAGSACLACFNPAERDGEKVRALENQLRNMSPDERSRFLAASGLDSKAIEDYLSGAPCGGLGEAALKDFAIRPPAQFSAGFVSLGAGLLLAAALLRNTIYVSSTPRRNDMSTLNFLNGRLIDAGFGADDTCELRCQQRDLRTGS